MLILFTSRDIKLMYGETLIDMPEDWEAKWIVIPYPKGKRCMVKAGNGKCLCMHLFRFLSYSCVIGKSLSLNKWGK